MVFRSLCVISSALLFGPALPAAASPAAPGPDRRPTGPIPQPQTQTKSPPQPESPPDPRRRGRDCPPPCPPPPCPPEKPGATYEITILCVDADRAAVPAVSAFLAGVSNPKEQRAGLLAQVRRGVPILQISGGQTLRVRQNATGTRDADGSRSRITARPHLNAGCAEAVDFLVEQAPQNPSQTGIGTHVSLVFENGDTRLLSDTARPDGTCHLLYATVFFPPGPAPCPR